jgi:hypothetical protein
MLSDLPYDRVQKQLLVLQRHFHHASITETATCMRTKPTTQHKKRLAGTRYTIIIYYRCAPKP